MAASVTATRTSFQIAQRRRYPFGSIQNFIASVSRKKLGIQVAREPNIGGSVKSNAAASQSSGCRGILVSHSVPLPLLFLLLLLPMLLLLKLSSLEPAKCAHALVEMWFANCRRNL